MKHAQTATQPNHKKDEHAHRRYRLSMLAIVALACILCLILLQFVRSYRALRAGILQERIDYVEEISAQIMTGQLFMEREYSAEAADLANILARQNVAELEDVHQYAAGKDKQEVLLLSEANHLIDLNGRHISVSDAALAQKLLDSDGVSELFTSLNYAEDSWLFAAPFPPKEIGGTVYKAVILSVPANEFRDSMTISLLDDCGASYIVDNSGRIKLKPLSQSLAFNGYNLLSSMLSEGAPAEDIEQIKRALQSGEAGSTVLRAGGLDWLVAHTPIDGETSAQTYRGLSSTILYASLAILAVALIAIVLLVQFFLRDRARRKAALALAAKSDFYSKMSHDIRTPLNAVIGLMQLAQDDSHSPTVKEYLTQALSSASYLLSIINDVLEMSRIESGKLSISESPFDMGALLRDVKAVTKPLLEEKALLFADEADHPFDTEYIGDEVRVKQILTNLLSNAAKFTKPGGFVGLRVTSASRPDGYDTVTMVVSDTGIGMSEQFLQRIFTPFEQEHSSYTQQYAGSGLGLSIVHDLVQRMGGAIEVASRVGEGSAFTVTLPLLRGAAIAKTEQPKAQETATFSGRRILLAEDNAVSQMVAVKILAAKFDIEACTAADGEIALALFAASPPGAYDMILMDVKMPNMDGLQATRAIRALPRPDAKTIPIIALSANAYKEDMELSLAAGMNDHLSKPLDIAALAAVLQRFLCAR